MARFFSNYKTRMAHANLKRSEVATHFHYQDCLQRLSFVYQGCELVYPTPVYDAIFLIVVCMPLSSLPEVAQYYLDL